MYLSLVHFPLRLARMAVLVAVLWVLGGQTSPPLRAADVASAQVTETAVNLHAGPGLQYAVRGQVRKGTNLALQGRSADNAWLAVADPGERSATLWIDADRTDVGARRYVLPWAGPSAVCTRSPDVQAALLAALALQGRARTCMSVTWTDLAVLTALSPTMNDRLSLGALHDLAGLTGLRTARVVVTDAYIAAGGRLSGLAALERLNLQSACCADIPWPDHFLAGAARLHDLALEDMHYQNSLPADFLARVPQLQALSLDAYGLVALPENFLAPVPQLQTLSLNTRILTALPEDFLAHTPQLQTLSLSSCFHEITLAALPEGFLAHVPQLQTLSLGLCHLAALPEGFLVHTPQLQTLSLSPNYLTALPEGFLVHTPQLQTLSLSLNHLTALPEGFLAHVPQLQTLSLDTSSLAAALPERFLAHVPQLQTLSLATGNLAALPEGFLAHVPQLATFNLDAHRLAALPEGFLVHAPQLATFNLDAPQLTALPESFLAHVPRLHTLTLAEYYNPALFTALPESFLAHAPQLAAFNLDAPRLIALPENFLAHAPQLTAFNLDAPQLTALPENFLAHAPQLAAFNLDAPRLIALPRGFLAHAPRLQTLTLETGHALAWPDGPTETACRRVLTLRMSVRTALDFLQLHAPCLRRLDLALTEGDPAQLVDLPQLEALTLYVDSKTAWLVGPAGLLAHAPRLRILELHAAGPLPRDFLAYTPQLQTLTLALTDARLPAHTLVEVPQLTQFWLQAPDLHELPPGFLAHAPRLRRLEIEALSLSNLSVGFLANAPRLRHLSLDTWNLAVLPDDFLAHAPHLTTFTLRQNRLASLPEGFLAHVPRLERLSLNAESLAVLPDDFLAHAPRLRVLDLDLYRGRNALTWHVPALTAIGDRVLAYAPALVTFALDAPRLASVGVDFLARADRLQTLTLLMAEPAPLRIGAGFLAHAPQVRAVRIGAQALPDAQTDLGAAALVAPVDFLADLPRLRTVELLTPLRDPPPSGFLRSTVVRDLRLRVRIAANAQGAPRLPAVVQAAAWHLELTCDSAYPAAWLAPLATEPPTALTVSPCLDEGQRWYNASRYTHPPPRLSLDALRAFLASAPPTTRLSIAHYAQLAPTAYASLPASALEFRFDSYAFTGWVRAAGAQIDDDYMRRPPDRALPVHAEPHADAPVLGYLEPNPDPMARYRFLERTAEPESWLRIPYPAAAAAELAPILGADALEALYLVGYVPPALTAHVLAGGVRAPALLLETGLWLDEVLAALRRAPPTSVRHVGARLHLGAPAQQRWHLVTHMHWDLADALSDLDFACLQLVLPSLRAPPPAQLNAAVRRHDLDLRLVADFAPDRLTVRPLSVREATQRLALDAADYFQQQHLAWAADHACPRSLLLIDAASPSTYPRVEWLPPNLLDRPGVLQRVRIVFDPRQCPACRTDLRPH